MSRDEFEDPYKLFTGVDVSRIAAEEEPIIIQTRVVKRNKIVTEIIGLEGKVDLKQLVRQLKKRLACGGTAKEGKVILQGDHKHKVAKILKEEYGFRNIQIL